jgi:hypothetical protein
MNVSYLYDASQAAVHVLPSPRFTQLVSQPLVPLGSCSWVLGASLHLVMQSAVCTTQSVWVHNAL